MRELLAFVLCLGAAGCCAGPSGAMVQTATTSIKTQAEVAKAAVATCGGDSAERADACDRITRSLEDLLATNNQLQAQAKP